MLAPSGSAVIRTGSPAGAAHPAASRERAHPTTNLIFTPARWELTLCRPQLPN